jgi:hypothetical protein
MKRLPFSLLLLLLLVPQQALPLKHPIRAYVAEDRQARTQAHKRLHPQQLQAEGAVPLLLLSGRSAAAAGGGAAAPQHRTQRSSSSSSSGRSSSSSGLQHCGCTGGSNPEQLLFCSKHWLLQVDPKTGGHSSLLG